jgi:nitrogen fixation/metabolism regulation signal transduction histidine kinase
MLEEHLTDTPLTIKKELKKTNDKIDALAKEFNDMNEKMSAQANEAAAAKASIAAIHKS